MPYSSLGRVSVHHSMGKCSSSGPCSQMSAEFMSIFQLLKVSTEPILVTGSSPESKARSIPANQTSLPRLTNQQWTSHRARDGEGLAPMIRTTTPESEVRAVLTATHCLVCDSDLLLPVMRSVPVWKVHCNTCGSEVPLHVHLDRASAARRAVIAHDHETKAQTPARSTLK